MRAGYGALPRMRVTPSLVLAVALLPAAVGCKAPPPPAKPPVAPHITGACFVCMKPINGDGGVRAILPPGFERTYRCIHCALIDLRKHDGAVAIARSLVSGTEIRITVYRDRWMAFPAEPVFLHLREIRGNCFKVHQTFVDAAEFAAYVADHPEVQAADAQPMAFADYRRLIEESSAP